MSKRVKDTRRKRGATELVGSVMDGKIRIERLPTTQYLSARMWLNGGHVRRTTGETSLARAKAAATKLYARLLLDVAQGASVRQVRARTFGRYAEQFFADATEQRRRSEGQWRNLRDKWTMLEPPPPEDGKPAKAPVMVRGVSVAQTRISDIDLAWLEDLREIRSEVENKRGETLSNETLKKDLQFVFQVLKFAKSQGVISALPDMPTFDGEWAVGRTGNPSLSMDEVRHLFAVARTRIAESANRSVREQRTMAYRFAHVCIDAALRVDEGLSIRWCDINEYTRDGQQFVSLSVLGKHTGSRERETAVGTAESAVILRDMHAERPDAKPHDLVFSDHLGTAREWFDAARLRNTPNGVRTRKCYRVTGITMRIEEHISRGQELPAETLAKWARTSPEMIRSFYDQSHPERSGEMVLRRRPPVEPPMA